MKSINKNGLLLITIIMLAAFMAPIKSSAQDKKVGFGLCATPALTWMKPDDEKVLNRDGTKTGFGDILHHSGHRELLQHSCLF